MEHEFFATAAQVVPVLALAGVIEWRQPRVKERLWPAWADPVTRLVMFLALILAEVAAFTALAGRPTETERTYTIMGLGIGGAALVFRFGEHALDDVIATIGNRWVRTAIVVAWTAAALGAVLVPTLAVAF